MTPIGSPREAQEVPDLILFLASARAAFIRGANITIDGGANPGLIGLRHHDARSTCVLSARTYSLHESHHQIVRRITPTLMEGSSAPS
jgi:hypothetical protein